MAGGRSPGHFAVPCVHTRCVGGSRGVVQSLSSAGRVPNLKSSFRHLPDPDSTGTRRPAPPASNWSSSLRLMAVVGESRPCSKRSIRFYIRT
jgi:hypothetical protein